VRVVAFAVVSMDRARRLKGLALNFDHVLEDADQGDDARPLLRIVEDRDAGPERIPGVPIIIEGRDNAPLGVRFALRLMEYRRRGDARNQGIDVAPDADRPR